MNKEVLLHESEGNTLSVRKFRPEDLKKLLYIFRLNVPEFFAPHEEVDFKKYLETNRDSYFSITNNGNIIGGAGYKINSSELLGSVSWIFLDPDHTGKGIGKKVVSFLLKIFTDFKDVVILRAETSQHGVSFFGSLGFTTVKKQKDYWGMGLDLYRMEMKKESI
jgi:ribosomal protein S18 acetylase RimI-like enzyme